MKTKVTSGLRRTDAGKPKCLDCIPQAVGSETREIQFRLPTVGLRNDCLRSKSYCKPRKGQEGPTKTETPSATVVAGPGQCIGYFPTRMRGHVKVIPGGPPVYWGGAKGPIPIGSAILQGH
jgi:hypothetical protein